MAVFQTAYSQDESFTSDSKQTAVVQKIVPVCHVLMCLMAFMTLQLERLCSFLSELTSSSQPDSQSFSGISGTPHVFCDMSQRTAWEKKTCEF